MCTGQPMRNRPVSAADRLGASLLLALVIALVAFSQAAVATPVKEAPWRADAAAYRATLFLGNLVPVPWDDIARAWRAPYPQAQTTGPAIDLIDPEAARAIEAAVANKDRQALHASASRAIVAALVDRLDRAEAALDGGNAATAVAEARELYRAFEDGIAAADPTAARRLGLAWLELASAGGSRGILGTGTKPAERDRFTRAKAEIADYVSAEFSPAAFTSRATLQPVPESSAAAGAIVDLPAWLPPGSFMGDQTPLPRLVLNFEEQGIDETDLPPIAFGDMLFDSPQIFGEPARSVGIACATCHNRSDINRDFFIPGVSHQPGAADVDGSFFNPLFNDRRADSLDIPSLRGLRFTAPYGRDGRFASLREFTRNVIVNEFAGPEPTPFMLDALVAYLLEFDFLPNAKLTSDGQLADAAADAARRGEEVFERPFAQMDGKSCATCHVPSSNFLDGRAHDIGSGGEAYAGSRGGALDTPTLLGLRFTAPYFHDGSLPTLASVVAWKDDRYGLGLGETEQADLAAYLEAVGDADEPFEAFDDRNTPFRLAFQELTTFASTLDALLPRRDAAHALLMIETVSADLAADASAMANLDAKPEVYTLAETLGRIGKAIRAEDWPAAEAEWAAFKALQAEIDERMF